LNKQSSKFIQSTGRKNLKIKVEKQEKSCFILITSPESGFFRAPGKLFLVSLIQIHSLIFKLLFMANPTPLHSCFVGQEKVNDRVKRYQFGDRALYKGKHQLLSDKMEEQSHFQGETKYVWYSKQYFEDLITEINLYSGDGIRVYFGEYENENGVPAGQLCLLMVVTKPDASDAAIHRDVIMENEPGFDTRVTVSGTREMNIGAPCPPICDTEGVAFPQ
jgi:hypothetical protein